MLKKVLLTFFLVIFSSSTYAKEIKIISDRLEIFRTESKSIFFGNVYAVEDNLKIWSEKLVITSSQDNNSIEEINAEDNVKILRQDLSIKGDKAKYNPKSEILIVFGKVIVSQNGNMIYCDEIIVDLKNSSSIMKGGSMKRVEAVIISANRD